MCSLRRIHHRSHYHHHTRCCYQKRADTIQQALGISPSAIALNGPVLDCNARGALAHGVKVPCAGASVHHNQVVHCRIVVDYSLAHSDSALAAAQDLFSSDHDRDHRACDFRS